MTPKQKSFAAWIERFKQVCVHHGAELKPDYCGDKIGAWRAHFITRFGGLNVSMHLSDYTCETQRGWVSIYVKFDYDVDAGEVAPNMWGDFNRFSGKWNIHFGNGKENLDTSRALAIAELKRRLKFCKELEPLTPKN
jgi:hypothetical protein